VEDQKHSCALKGYVNIIFGSRNDGLGASIDRFALKLFPGQFGLEGTLEFSEAHRHVESKDPICIKRFHAQLADTLLGHCWKSSKFFERDIATQPYEFSGQLGIRLASGELFSKTFLLNVVDVVQKILKGSVFVDELCRRLWSDALVKGKRNMKGVRRRNDRIRTTRPKNVLSHRARCRPYLQPERGHLQVVSVQRPTFPPLLRASFYPFSWDQSFVCSVKLQNR
jgi:hypothetical protein